MNNLLKMIAILAVTIVTTQANNFSRIIKDRTHETTIKLDRSTVRCSALGYGSAELKITVPSLKWNAIFDHSNTDGRGPCVTAGRMSCSAFLQFPAITPGSLPDLSLPNNSIPDVLIDAEKPEERISVRVFLTEEFNIREEICTRTLKENVVTMVRGIEFKHQRVKSIGELPISECVKVESSL
ncbi:hypothetical protein A9Q84_15780 [Halobacteriovorax marinus]|uniref:Uncharacterized protein n=1 Tax=Halobacteriovorax marinus TaxID=97084 RepID=A0A1Y5F9F3_9BACT|nr:hypothetical protein A9Q84_15780 [Halobacteriovorax marinus]